MKLHLLKIRRRRAVVSSTLLWTDSLRDQRASAPFRRLKPNLLLLLHILVILLLALALARPTRTVFVTGYERTVFILDLSASMQATDVAGSRFAAAKAALAGAIEGRGSGQQAMLIASARDAEVVVPFTSDRDALRRGLDGVTALDVPGRMAEALTLAQTNLQVRASTAAVEVFSDAKHQFAVTPSILSNHSWNLIFGPTRAKDAYQQHLQKRARSIHAFIPSTSP